MDFLRERDTTSALYDADDDDLHRDGEDDGNLSPADESEGKVIGANEQHVDPAAVAALEAMRSSGSSAVRAQQQGGPKGVLADYREHVKQQLEYVHQALERKWQREEMRLQAKKNAFTVLSRREEEALSAKMALLEAKQDEILEDDNRSEEDEDDFLARRRRERMKQLRGHTTRCTFGQMVEVDADGYLAAVERSGPDTHVVLHMHEKFVPACRLLEGCLGRLAQRVPAVRFISATATELKPQWDLVTLPTILVYKDGKLVHTLLRVTDILGDEFDSFDVQKLLSSKGITPEPDPMVAIRGDLDARVEFSY